MRGDKGIDVTVRDAGVSNHAEECAHRMRIPCGHQHTPQDAVYWGVPHVDDFVGFHLEDFVTFGNGIAL